MLTLQLASLQLGLLLSKLWKCTAVSCVSELKPLCVVVLLISLAFFLSGSSNQCINGGFVGAKTPQMAQPLSTCCQFCISQCICVLWMGLAPAVCLNLR